MEEFRVIIAGTRNFSNYELLKEKCNNILSAKRQDSNIVILSGTAKGADRLGERYARERGFLLRRFPADWDKDGNKAGPIRNAKMADNADALIAFWDGTSRGTAHMIMTAKEKGLATRVINYKIAVKMNENQKTEKLLQETADNTIKYIKTVHEIEDKDEHLEDPKYQAAMQAIVDRVMDYGAKSFTPEQIGTLERVVADCENETQREHAYERLWKDTEPRLTDAMKEWKDDAHEELRDLAHGIARSDNQSLKR